MFTFPSISLFSKLKCIMDENMHQYAEYLIRIEHDFFDNEEGQAYRGQVLMIKSHKHRIDGFRTGQKDGIWTECLHLMLLPVAVQRCYHCLQLH